jgi:hypothetical protein
MKKELLMAIIGSFILGLIIMGGVWTANNAINTQRGKNPVNLNQSNNSTKPSPVPTQAPFFLTIIKPEGQSIINTEQIVISGNTLPNIPVVMVWENGENIIQSDSAGNFDGEIGLISGVNEITITVFAQDGKQVSKKIGLVYSKESI